ncbi:MAG: stage V sporulation protein AD [Bacillota bacterium]
MLIGTRSFQFDTPAVIVDQHTMAGPLEKQGHLTAFVDQFISDLYDHEKTYDLCYNKLIRQTIQTLTMRHPHTTYVFTGDLINQSTPTHYGLMDTQLVPMTYDHACASFGLSLANGALMLQEGHKQVIAGAMSHFAAVEKQFRFPNEYGQQKPPSSQTTVTGGGFCVLATEGNGPKITYATLGHIYNAGFKDPYNMGEAMAPACFDTLLTHFDDCKVTPADYDYIITGDLGAVGQAILFDLLVDHGYKVKREQLIDAGCEIFNKNQSVMSGGSGAGCLSLFLLSKGMKQLFRQSMKVLVIATGALHSPVALLQTPVIPTIAHLVVIET